MAERRTLTFKINEVTPDKLPAGRLADYIKDLSALFGTEDGHLIEIGGNSTDLAFLFDSEAEPVVKQRLTLVGTNDAPQDLAQKYQSIDARLRKDEWSAIIHDDQQHKVVEFPGVKAETVVVYPPIVQPATADGIPIRVGGKEDMVPVHLQDGDTFHYCTASRDIAARIGEMLFKKFIRVKGEARWKRTVDGEWIRYRFVINDFEELNDEPLTATVERLRNVPNSGWANVPDAVKELRNLRDGES
jgi:hypothetical protein